MSIPQNYGIFFILILFCVYECFCLHIYYILCPYLVLMEARENVKFPELEL